VISEADVPLMEILSPLVVASAIVKHAVPGGMPGHVATIARSKWLEEPGRTRSSSAAAAEGVPTRCGGNVAVALADRVNARETIIISPPLF
jgi:hypothetical protein